jgi:DNA polymerase (family 10)
MDNKTISSLLTLYGKLRILHGENEFRAKPYLQSGFIFNKLNITFSSLSADEILGLKDLSKSLSSKVVEILATGTFSDLEQIQGKTPEGIIDMLQIRGLGPSKVRELWKQLGIESPGELLYACMENRLLELKGFGKKTQDTIIQELEFSLKNKNKWRYASVEPLALELLERLTAIYGVERVALAGEFRRQNPVIHQLELVGVVTDRESFRDVLTHMGFDLHQHSDREWKLLDAGRGLQILFHLTTSSHFHSQWLLRSADPEHIASLGPISEEVVSEQQAYQMAGVPYHIPAMRDVAHQKYRPEQRQEVLDMWDIKGAIHNHSVWSDGQHTIREMAAYCIMRGWEYLVICDHSVSATYANGLNEERLYQQWEEIQQINKELFPFKVFKGIESDILSDGSLDYPPSILSQLDVVVASVHSHLRMDEQKANTRLIRAIENPYTTILGHPTGRLLLSRKGYPIDIHSILDACAANGVSIELNANPHRLDIDWRYLDLAVQKNVWVSINPDAHYDKGLDDMRYGILVAQKAGLSPKHVLNGLSLSAFETYIEQKKNRI